MPANQVIDTNLAKANDRLKKIEGTQPTPVIEAHMSVATVYLLGALVEAVRELTDEIRTTRTPLTCDKSPAPTGGREP